MANTRTTRSAAQRSHAWASLPPGVIPEPRAVSDPPLPTAPPAPPRRRRTALLVALPLVGAAAAAGAIVAVSGSPDAPAQAVAPAAPRSAEDVGFLRTVRQQIGFAPISDDNLVKIGHMVCSQLQGGVNPDDIAMGSSAATLSIADVSTAVGAAAGAYCPDQIGRVGATG
jgi:hypothetical protein